MKTLCAALRDVAWNVSDSHTVLHIYAICLPQARRRTRRTIDRYVCTAQSSSKAPSKTLHRLVMAQIEVRGCRNEHITWITCRLVIRSVVNNNACKQRSTR